MSIESWIDVSIAVFALIVLTAAGIVEACLVRKQRLTIRELLEQENGPRDAEQTVDPATLLRSATDVIGLVAMLAIAVTLTRLGAREMGGSGALLALVAGLIGIVLFGRAIPQVIAERTNASGTAIIDTMATVVGFIAAPFTVTGNAVAGMMLRVVGGSNSAETNGVRNGHGENGEPASDREFEELEEDEHEMISGILRMEDATVREIMVPRPDVVAVPIDMSIPQVVNVALQAGHSRIPVYGESIDQIRGIVYAKDLLHFVSGDATGATLGDLMRGAEFVPESKRVDDLLRDLRRSKVHMAVVVDEYGGTAGIVTIEDVLEEIVGEIQDEYDRELPLYELDATGTATVDGRMGVDELSEVLRVELPETESETIGGFVQRQLGHIPEAGESVEVGPIAIEVESVEKRRIRSLKITYVEQPEPIDASDPVRAH